MSSGASEWEEESFSNHFIRTYKRRLDGYHYEVRSFRDDTKGSFRVEVQFMRWKVGFAGNPTGVGVEVVRHRWMPNEEEAIALMQDYRDRFEIYLTEFML